MTITELIEELKHALSQVGDVRVVWCDDQDCPESVDHVTPDDVNKIVILR